MVGGLTAKATLLVGYLGLAFLIVESVPLLIFILRKLESKSHQVTLYTKFVKTSSIIGLGILMYVFAK